ncbi:MAG: LysE family translocator [Chloroflexota bacterium]
MAEIEWQALLSFVLISTHTPGPNNITAASMGVMYGYRKTLNFIFGIMVAFFLAMFVSGIISRTVLTAFPIIENIMRIVGAVYIFWLAFKTLKTSYSFDVDESPPLVFSNGFMLSALNPKVLFFAFTLFSTFLAPITEDAGKIFVAALILTLFAFSAVSVWALFGAGIRKYLDNQTIQRVINTVLALLLVYSAIELFGI